MHVAGAYAVELPELQHLAELFVQFDLRGELFLHIAGKIAHVAFVA